MGHTIAEGRYHTKYFFQVIIVLSIPLGYIIHLVFSTGHTLLSGVLTICLYLLVARNVKKAIFDDSTITVLLPFKFFNRRKCILYRDVLKLKRGHSYNEGEMLIIYYRENGNKKKIILGYPSEYNKIGIINILKEQNLYIEEP